MGNPFVAGVTRAANMAVLLVIALLAIVAPLVANAEGAAAIANEDALLFYEAQHRKRPGDVDIARRYALELADATAELTERGNMGAAKRLLYILASLQITHPEDLALAQARAVGLYNCLRGQAIASATNGAADDVVDAYLQVLMALQAAFPHDDIVLQALSSSLRIQCATAAQSGDAARIEQALQGLASLQTAQPGNLHVALQYANALHDAVLGLPAAHAPPRLQALTALQKAFPQSGELDALIKDAYARHLSVTGAEPSSGALAPLQLPAYAPNQAQASSPAPTKAPAEAPAEAQVGAPIETPVETPATRPSP